jgi:hypothetical protein
VSDVMGPARLMAALLPPRQFIAGLRQTPEIREVRS